VNEKDREDVSVMDIAELVVIAEDLI